MSIRAMTKEEIKRALRHAAEVCIADGRICWSAIDVCRADGVYEAACEYSQHHWADTPAEAANFLLFVAEAL